MASLVTNTLFILLFNIVGMLSCPQKCSCKQRTVLCRGRKFERFPENISRNTTILDLRDNSIKRFSKADLVGLQNLKVLLLTHNQIRTIDENVLDELPELRKLYLSRNKLEMVPSSWSRTESHLEYLELHGNQILHLNDNFTKKLPYLRFLDLSENNIQTLSESLFHGSQLQIIHLKGNPLNCDCRWLRIQTLLKGKLGRASLLCFNPLHLRQKNMLTLDERHLKCHKAVSERYGSSLLLKCSVGGHAIDWMYRSRKLDEEYNGEYELLANGTLSVDASENVNNFQCAVNYYLNPKRPRRQLLASSRPKFLIKPKDRSYAEGTAVRIVCEAIGFPQPKLKWLFNGHQIVNSRKYELRKDGTTLMIFPFLENDVGRYTCTAENSHGSVEASARIAMIPSIPPQIIDEPLSVTVPEGSMAVFKCRVHAQPKPTITWAFDGKIIPVVKGHYQVSPDGTLLTIGRVTRGDSGIYTCMGGNSVGSMTVDARLTVTPLASKHSIMTHHLAATRDQDSTGAVGLRPNNAIKRKLSEAISPHEFLKWFQFAMTQTDELNKTREVYEESIQLIRKHTHNGLNLSWDKATKTASFETPLPQPHIDTMVQLTGCSVTQIKDSCADECYLSRYRTINGQCNNPLQTMWGASYTPFRRLLPPIYENGFNTPVGWNPYHLYFGFPKPNPRTVSMKLFGTKLITPHEKFSSMVMQWGQFIDHDIDFTAPAVDRHAFTSGAFCNTTCENKNPCYNIQLPSDDPKLERKHEYPCIENERSSPVCGSGETSLIYGQVTYREQMNTLTSYIDGSAIYGSTDEHALRLRDLESDQGLLRYDILSEAHKPYLPFDDDSVMDCKRNRSKHRVRCFLAGDVRANEQLGLLSLHTIMMREHNNVAMRFAQQNPRLDGETIFQESRKIVAAEMQHITFQHWLPVILGKDNYEKLIGVYNGYHLDVDASVSNAFATAAYRFGHSLVNPFLFRFDRHFKPYAKGHIPLRDAFFSPEIIISDGIDPIIRGLFASPMKKPLVKQLVNAELTEQLFHKAHDVSLDLMAINIQRGRDHGLPGYLEYRKWCNITQVNSWEDLRKEMPDEIIMKLRDLYGHPGNIDLFVGGMVEQKKNDALVGPTFACIIANQFRRLRDGDRFWYEKEGVFTEDQRNEIKKASLARILCHNSDSIDRIQEDVFTYVGSRLEDYIECKKFPRIDYTRWRRCCYRYCSVRDNFYRQNHKRRRSTVNGCEEEGKFYRNKQTWRRGCHICNCQKGRTQCRKDPRCKNYRHQNNSAVTPSFGMLSP